MLRHCVTLPNLTENFMFAKYHNMMKIENVLLDSSSEALWDAPIPHLTQ